MNFFHVRQKGSFCISWGIERKCDIIMWNNSLCKITNEVGIMLQKNLSYSLIYCNWNSSLPFITWRWNRERKRWKHAKKSPSFSERSHKMNAKWLKIPVHGGLKGCQLFFPLFRIFGYLYIYKAKKRSNIDT